MKTTLQKISLMAMLSAIWGWSNAQITITQADMPGIGTVISEGNDTVTNANPGGTGTQTWDFSTLQPHTIDTTTLLSPTGQPGSSYFPGADIVIANQTQGLISGYIYLDVTSTEISQMGVYGDFGFGMMPLVFEPPIKAIVFPSTYQTQHNGTTKYSVQFAYPAPPIDSVKVIITQSYDCIIDAYGSLTTPSGTYNALRKKNSTTKIDSTFLHNSATNSWSFSSSDTTITTDYTFLANNVFSALDIDENGRAKYLIDMSTDVKLVAASDISVFVYPNPSSEVLNFEGNLTLGTMIEIFDINGKMMAAVKAVTAKISIDTKHYPEGLYLYRIVTAEQKSMVDKFNVVR